VNDRVTESGFDTRCAFVDRGVGPTEVDHGASDLGQPEWAELIGGQLSADRTQQPQRRSDLQGVRGELPGVAVTVLSVLPKIQGDAGHAARSVGLLEPRGYRVKKPAAFLPTLERFAVATAALGGVVNAEVDITTPAGAGVGQRDQPTATGPVQTVGGDGFFLRWPSPRRVCFRAWA